MACICNRSKIYSTSQSRTYGNRILYSDEEIHPNIGYVPFYHSRFIVFSIVMLKHETALIL